MNLPGGDDLLDHATGMLFDFWQRLRVERQGGNLTLWQDQSQKTKAQWMDAHRAFAEIIVVALIADQRAVLREYDPILGPALEAAIVRYSKIELNHDPATAGHSNGE